MNTHAHDDKQEKAGSSDVITETATDAGTTSTDPVCGMTVDPATAKGGSAEHAGTTYHFCSTGCHDKF
ncbi:MAG: YHS domain-containing protein, partial [Thermomonas sp.]